MGETRGQNWNLWGTDTANPHGQTCLARGSYERCADEQTYLTSMAEQFDGRDPYPRRVFTIELA